jgi:hypothetical protein
MSLLQNLELSDMLSGASGDKINLGWKHRASYWKRQGVIESEAFANMFSAATRNEKAYNLLKKCFPSSIGVFEEILRLL